MAKRKTLKKTRFNSPHDAVIPPKEPEVLEEDLEEEPVREKRGRQKGRKTVAVGFRIPEDLSEWIKSAAYWTKKGTGEIAEKAFTAYLKRLERQRGEPFPRR